MIVLMRLIRPLWRAVIFSETQKATRSSGFSVDMAQSLRLQVGSTHSGFIIFTTDCNSLLLVEKSHD